jgi:hypothetical protein
MPQIGALFHVEQGALEAAWGLFHVEQIVLLIWFYMALELQI